MRRILCLLLLVLLPLQSFAAQSALRAMDWTHEIDHAHGTSHHHGQDGAIHYDDSQESLEHGQEHSACQQIMALLPASLPAPDAQADSALVAMAGRDWRDIFLERPQRPPASPG